MMFKRSLTEQIGLLDENYFLYYEETDYCYRINRIGKKILFYPEAKIVHLYDQTTKGLKDKVLNTLKSEYYFFKNNYKTPLLNYKIIKISGYMLSFAIYSLLYILTWKKMFLFFE